MTSAEKRHGPALRNKLRIVVDAAMATCLVAVMATALVEEAPHEYLGIALFALMVAHVVLGRRWVQTLRRGRTGAVRVVQAVLMAGVALCLVGQMASAVVLSRHALWFLPSLPGAALARRAHMMCSYWMFVLAFAHAGMQLKEILARMRVKEAPAAARTCAWAVWLAVAAFGAVSFVQLGVGGYLLGAVQFAFADYETPLALSLARWAAIAVFLAGCFHLLRGVLEAKGQKRT